MMSARRLKANFAVANKYEAFYTGGKVQLNAGGSRALCQCSNQIQVLDLSTGQIQRTVGQEEDDEITSFVLSPDDKVLVVASRNLLLKQWDWENSKVTRTWKAIHTAPVSCMSFDGTSTLLASGSADSTVKVWDVIRQYCTHNLRGHQGVVSIVKFHPDLEKLQLFTAADDYHIRVWSLQTSSQLALLEGHYSIVTSLQFSPDGNTLYSGGRDNVLQVWQTEKFTRLKTIPVYENVEAVILLPEDGDHSKLGITSEDPHLLTAGSKGVLRVWNATTAQCVFTQPGCQPTQETEASDSSGTIQPITGASYNEALNIISVVTFDHNIFLYKLSDLTSEKQFVGYYDEVLDIKLVGEDESQVAVATNSPSIFIFNRSSWDCQVLRGHTDTVLALDVHPKSDMIVSASKDAGVRIWQNKDGKYQCVAAGHGHTQPVNTASFSRLSSQFVVSGGQDCTLKVWSIPEQFGCDGEVTSLHSRVTEHAHDKDINSVMVAPNDQLIASGSQDKTAKLWKASNLSLVGVFRGHKRGIWCVQFSPVDQCLATGSADGTIKIWTLTDMACVKTFEGHEASVLRLQFLTRGMQLISSGSDGLIKLWTIKTNECVKTLDSHDDKVWALVADKEQNQVFSGGADSRIVAWKDVTTEEYEESLQKQEEFILKEQELFNLIHEKKWLKALAVAITLDQPFRALSIIKEMLTDDGGVDSVIKVMKKLRPDQLDAVLRYAVAWNTNSKHCHVAQLVMQAVLQNFTPQDLLKLANIKETVEGLLPYTERHFERMNKLQQQATFVEYTWQCMKLKETDSGIDDVEMVENTATAGTTT